MAKRHPQTNESPSIVKVEAPVFKTQQVSQAPQEKMLPISEKEYIVETEKFSLTFSSAGGSIKKIDLKEFPDSKTGEPYDLMSADDPRFYLGAASVVEEGLDTEALYQMERFGNKIIFTHESQNIKIEKTYIMYNSSDYIELYITINNNTDRDLTATTRLMGGSGINASSMMSQRYHYVSAKVDGKILWFKKETAKAGDVSWITLNNEYFVILTRPQQVARKVLAGIVKREDPKQKDIYGGIESETLKVAKGSNITQRYFIYIGPFDTKRLAALGMGLEEAVNYGKLSSIVKILLSTLGAFQKVVRNWGVAIICLTVLVNLILFPLTKNSYKSLKLSQDLQPQIEKLKAAHKDNPNKAQKEIMELYRKYKVNPLSGCLPMFLQFPIFFALYHALIRSIQLKGASFLWARDLSRPDALGLPFTLPFLGDSINILPILASAVMFLQQKVMSARATGSISDQMKQQQAMMAIMIPGMMLVFFYKMPSGFVLYFLVNSALMAYVQHKIKTQ